MTAGTIALVSLTGSEQVIVDNGGAVFVTATTAQIAALSGNGLTQDILNTAITTVGNGTLTAAALLGGLITRTGPVAAYTDTTASAAQIVTAIGSFNLGATFNVIIKNATAFVQTLSAGANVTLPVTLLIGPFQEAEYYGVVGGTAAVPTVTFGHVLTTAISLAPSISNPAAVTLSTVGPGTVLANAFVAGGTARTGAQSATAFTDTTDIAATIIAANPGLVGKIGSSVRYEYANLTNAPATITGGTGVTVSQPGGSLTTTAVIPAGMTGAFNLTYTAAATLTLVCIALSNNNASVMAFAGSTSGETTVSASAIAGASALILPPVTGTLASTSGSNLFVSDVYRNSAAQTANTNVVPAQIPGLVGAVAIGTYRFRAYLPSTVASGTGGIAYQSLLTTAVLSAMQCSGLGYTAAAVAVQNTTTATSAAVLFTQAAVVIATILEGTFTVSTAGTFGISMCQSASNASNSVTIVGGSLELTRIA